MKLGKMEEDVIDIFQEILDDFSELEFEFRAVSPGHFQMVSKTIRSSVTNITPEMRSSGWDPYKQTREKVFNFAKRLEPYLEEASDRLGDIGYRCTYNASENVQLISKFNTTFIIKVDCYELNKNKIKKFESFNESKSKKKVTKEELEEIEIIMIDLMDKFDYLGFEIEYHKYSSIPGLLSLRSEIVSTSFIKSLPNGKLINDVSSEIKEYLENDKEIIDRMHDIGFKYDLTQYTGQDRRFRIYFSRI